MIIIVIWRVENGRTNSFAGSRVDFKLELLSMSERRRENGGKWRRIEREWRKITNKRTSM